MAHITSEQIRDLSVSAVEDFLNRKVPLSEGLAKQASAAELNAEQIQRAVEATNSIAYLKILGMSDDRTVEFPLAKYAEVMSHIAIPSASASYEPQIEKVASVQSEEVTTEFETNAKLTFLIKEAAANKIALENLEVESINVKDNLIKLASAIRKDAAWMDKLASVTTAEEFGPLAVLVSGEKQGYRDLKDLGLFKEAQLKQVGEFKELYKQARQIIREMTERAGLQKRAEDLSRAQRSMFKNPISSAAGGVGKVMGKAVGNVAAAPGKAVGAMGAGIKNSFKKNLNNIVQGKPSARQAGQAAKSTIKPIAKTVGSLGGAALDAAFYNPGTESTTGRSNDVWNALQRD